MWCPAPKVSFGSARISGRHTDCTKRGLYSKRCPPDTLAAGETQIDSLQQKNWKKKRRPQWRRTFVAQLLLINSVSGGNCTIWFLLLHHGRVANDIWGSSPGAAHLRRTVWDRSSGACSVRGASCRQRRALPVMRRMEKTHGTHGQSAKSGDSRVC